MHEQSMAANTVKRSWLLVLGLVAIAFSSSSALAYWQFIERPPGLEVKPSPRYKSQQECESALKKREGALKKAYPDRYPLVGSCERFQ
jgi:hypothetical protein